LTLAKHLLVFGYILLSSLAYSQTLELDTHKKKLAAFLRLEDSLGSMRLENNSSYISGPGVAQPVKFRRKEDGIPDLVVYYFYFTNDSSIDYILYEWDDEIDKGILDTVKKSSKEINAFIAKYKGLDQQITQTFGKSESDGSLTDLSKIETGDFKKEDVWKPDDSTKIDLYTVLSGKYEQHGAVTINPTYQIRLYIYNLNKKAAETGLQRLDENKIKELDSVVKAFMFNLKNNDPDKARSALSPLIAGQLSAEKLMTLRQNVKLDQPLVLYFSGIQMGMDGSKIPMLQYKYEADNSTPPDVLIRVLFDEKGKILGIRSTKRQ
jgi:hypothetical protein